MVEFYNDLCNLCDSEFGNCCDLSIIRKCDTSKIKDRKEREKVEKVEKMVSLKKYKKEYNLTTEQEESMENLNKILGL